MLWRPVEQKPGVPSTPSTPSVPIWEQIVAQVTFAIAAGDLEVGSLIPSVRELAPQILVHPNTVARAYQELERLGVVVARRGKGMEITADAPALSRAYRQQVIRNRIRAALHEAVASALSPDEVRQLVEEELARANGEAAQRAAGRDRDRIREKH
jgi:GntR family transcriptional regulator